jgi:cobalt-zinc-cadmium efflux system membrane fusion protein
MPARLRKLPSLLLEQLPTLISLTLLAAIAAWGYIWDWKIPSPPELLHPSPEKKTEDAEKKGDKKEPRKPDQPLPLVKLDSEDALKVAGIKLQPVEERIVREHVTANGELDFDQDRYAHLSTLASGRAWSVHKHAGDEVKKDDVLALIACPQLAQLKFDLQQTLLSVQTREQYHKRLKDGGTTTAVKDLEQAKSSLREAHILLSKDRQSLQNLGLTIHTDELTGQNDEKIAARLRTLGIPDTLLQGLDSKTLTNNLLPMYAPFDGLVVKRDIVRGEMVNTTTPQFVLADLRRLWIMLYVRLEDVGKLRLDQEVAFHLDGPGEDAPAAKITWISAEVDEKTHTVMARADVPNPQGRLRPRTFGTARILVDEKKRVIVPNEALQFDGTSHLVFARGETATQFQPLRVTLGPRHEKFAVEAGKMPVKLGPRPEDFTVILSGVKAGQTIATSGSHALLSEMLKERIGGEE